MPRRKPAPPGMCTACCKRPHRPWLKTCQTCVDEAAAARRARAARRTAAGKCAYCGKREPLPTLKTCFVCAEARLEAKKTRAADRPRDALEGDRTTLPDHLL